MASYSHLTDKKFDAIEAIVEHQQINSNLMGRAVTNTQFLTATMMNLFIPNVIHLTHVHTALSLLKHNILTFDLILLAYAQKIYSQIKEHMEQELPMHFLVHKEAQSLYTAADLAYFRTGSNLLVGFKVKVSVFQEPLQLFKMEKIPLEFPNQGYDTTLTDLPQYIAMNDIDSDFLVFNQMPRLLRDQYYFYMIRIMSFAQNWFLLASWLCLIIDSLRRSSFVIAFYNPFLTLLFYVMWELISSC
jgi:hypothetical protein